MYKNVKLDQFIDRTNLPKDVKISTMTMNCKLPDFEFYDTNIAKYIPLNENNIISVSHKPTDDKTVNRSIIPKKKIKKAFDNQVTLVVRYKQGDTDCEINIKLFNNGSLQLTGCKSFEGTIDALELLFDILIKNNNLLIPTFNKNMFYSDANNLHIEKLINFKISMINSDFDMCFTINRAKLDEMLQHDICNHTDNTICFCSNFDTCDRTKCEHSNKCFQKRVSSSFEPLIYPNVNIKYMVIDPTTNKLKPITIIVCQKGPVLITGATTCKQIQLAYIFINKYMINNYKKIYQNEEFIHEAIREVK